MEGCVGAGRESQRAGKHTDQAGRRWAGTLTMAGLQLLEQRTGLISVSPLVRGLGGRSLWRTKLKGRSAASEEKGAQQAVAAGTWLGSPALVARCASLSMASTFNEEEERWHE